MHALGDDYDKIVGMIGASRRQMVALKNLQKYSIPFRFNITLTKQAVKHLREISKIAVDTGARVVNFITFNPFADQFDNKY